MFPVALAVTDWNPETSALKTYVPVRAEHGHSRRCYQGKVGSRWAGLEQRDFNDISREYPPAKSAVLSSQLSIQATFALSIPQLVPPPTSYRKTSIDTPSPSPNPPPRRLRCFGVSEAWVLWVLGWVVISSAFAVLSTFVSYLRFLPSLPTFASYLPCISSLATTRR